MRKKFLVILSLFIAMILCFTAPAVALADTVVVNPGGGNVTVIVPTNPGDGTSGPQIDGTCYADRLEVYPFFKTSGYSWPADDEYEYKEDKASVPYAYVPKPIELGIMGRNAYADAQVEIAKDHTYIYLYNTALAYTDADKSKFSAQIGAFQIHAHYLIPPFAVAAIRAPLVGIHTGVVYENVHSADFLKHRFYRILLRNVAAKRNASNFRSDSLRRFPSMRIIHNHTTARFRQFPTESLPESSRSPCNQGRFILELFHV